jgi:hypothetical protein
MWHGARHTHRRHSGAAAGGTRNPESGISSCTAAWIPGSRECAPQNDESCDRRQRERRVDQRRRALAVVEAVDVLLHQERRTAVEFFMLRVAVAELAAEEVPSRPARCADPPLPAWQGDGARGRAVRAPVNDLLFAGASRDEFAAVSEFLTRFAANTEDALEELRRTARRSADGVASERAATRRR